MREAEGSAAERRVRGREMMTVMRGGGQEGAESEGRRKGEVMKRGRAHEEGG